MGMNSMTNADYSLRYISPPRTFLGGMRVLVAGDTHGTVESLRAHFLQKRCEVDTAYTSEEIKRKLLGNSFDILICGFLVSDEYGLRIIEIVRHISDVRLLFLTGKKDSGFSTKALNLGADDCLTSPASFFELDARVLRLCHRNMNLSFRETKIILNQKGNIVEIDMSSQTVKKNGRQVSLTKMEYRILLHLALNKGRLVSKADLEKMFLRSSALLVGELGGSSVKAHICNLRRKFKTTLSIKTVSCHGFMLSAQEGES